MKQNIISTLCLVSLLSIVNAGIIRNEKICYNHDGKEIPCKLKISKKEDLGFKRTPKKREWGLFTDGWNFGDLFHDYSNDRDDHNHDYDDNSKDWNSNNDSFNERIIINDDDKSKDWNKGNDSFEGNTVTNDDWNKDNDSFGGNVDTSKDDNEWNQQTSNENSGNFGEQWDNSWTGQTNDSSSSNTIDLGDIDQGLDDTGVDDTYEGVPGIGFGAPQDPSSHPTSTYYGSAQLPMNGLTMTSFHGCNSHEASSLQTLIDDITTYRAAANYVLNHLEEDSMFEQIFLKYFHGHDHLSYIKNLFGEVNSMSTVEAYCETADNGICGDRAIAYTYEDSREFHVCPDFFTQPLYGSINDHQSEAAAIILHELTHCYGTDDHAYGETNSQALDSARASNNADTYRLFATKCIYYLNERGSGKSFKKMMLSKDEKIDFRDSPFQDRVLPPKKQSN